MDEPLDGEPLELDDELGDDVVDGDDEEGVEPKEDKLEDEEEGHTW